MSGKTKEEIAFDLVSKLKGVGVWGENNMADILDMYAECLEATSGLRNVKGVTSAQAETVKAAEPQEFVPQQPVAAQAVQEPVHQHAVHQQPAHQQAMHQQPAHMAQTHNLVQQG